MSPEVETEDGDSPPRPAKHEVLLPFPGSLCHRCAAPPSYVATRTSIYIRCPLLPNKYPPQPVLTCRLFRPKEAVPQHPRADPSGA